MMAQSVTNMSCGCQQGDVRLHTAYTLYQYVTNLLNMGQVYRTKHHPGNNYTEVPHSINVHSAHITRNCKTQSSSPQNLSTMSDSIFIPLREFSNAPSISSENDSRAVFQLTVDSELDDPFAVHLVVSG